MQDGKSCYSWKGQVQRLRYRNILCRLARSSRQERALISTILPIGTVPRRFAARLSGLASGLALAVRPAGLAEVSRVNGAHARPRGRSMQPQRRA